MGPPNLSLQLSSSAISARLPTSRLETNLVLMKPSRCLFGHLSHLVVLPYSAIFKPDVGEKRARPCSEKGASSILLLLKPLPLI